MKKGKIKITNMSHPNSVKTVVGVLTTLESTQRMKVKLRKMESLSLNLILPKNANKNGWHLLIKCHPFYHSQQVLPNIQ